MRKSVNALLAERQMARYSRNRVRVGFEIRAFRLARGHMTYIFFYEKCDLIYSFYIFIINFMYSM